MSCDKLTFYDSSCIGNPMSKKEIIYMMGDRGEIASRNIVKDLLSIEASEEETQKLINIWNKIIYYYYEILRELYFYKVYKKLQRKVVLNKKEKERITELYEKCALIKKDLSFYSKDSIDIHINKIFSDMDNKIMGQYLSEIPTKDTKYKMDSNKSKRMVEGEPLWYEDLGEYSQTPDWWFIAILQVRSIYSYIKKRELEEETLDKTKSSTNKYENPLYSIFKSSYNKASGKKRSYKKKRSNRKKKSYKKKKTKKKKKKRNN